MELGRLFMSGPAAGVIDDPRIRSRTSAARLIDRPRSPGPSAAVSRPGWPPCAGPRLRGGDARIRRSTLDELVLTRDLRSRKRATPGVWVRRPGAVALEDCLPSSAWMVRAVRGMHVEGRLAVHLHAVDAAGIDAFDRSGCARHTLTEHSVSAACVVVAGIQHDQPLVAGLADQRGLRRLR